MSRSDFGKSKKNIFRDKQPDPGKVGFDGPLLKYLCGYYPLNKGFVYVWDSKMQVFRMNPYEQNNRSSI